jgi:hypothetical protein
MDRMHRIIVVTLAFASLVFGGLALASLTALAGGAGGEVGIGFTPDGLSQ